MARRKNVEHWSPSVNLLQTFGSPATGIAQTWTKKAVTAIKVKKGLMISALKPRIILKRFHGSFGRPPDISMTKTNKSVCKIQSITASTFVDRTLGTGVVVEEGRKITIAKRINEQIHWARI